MFTVEAKPGKLQELYTHMEWVAEVCNDKEPDTLRFEVYQDPNNDQAFYIYEAYRDRAAFETHKQNEPYQRWDAVRREELTTNFKLLFAGEALTFTSS